MRIGDSYFSGDDSDKFEVRLDRSDNSATVKIGNPVESEIIIFTPAGCSRTFDYLTELRNAINEALDDPMFADQREQARVRALKAETLRCSDCGHTMTREQWEVHVASEARFDEEYVGIDEDGICPECEKGQMMEEVA